MLIKTLYIIIGKVSKWGLKCCKKYQTVESFSKYRSIKITIHLKSLENKLVIVVGDNKLK